MLRPMAAYDDFGLLARIERYYDAVPRARAEVQEVGPFTLFVARSGWPYYARPRLGGASQITADDVRAALARQHEQGLPRALEWVDEVTPGLAAAAESAGVQVARCPLLVLDGPPRGSAGTARMLDPDVDDDLTDLALGRAAVAVGFGHPGTAAGAAGLAERDAATGSGFADVDDTLLASLRARRLRSAAAYDGDSPALGPVGGGSHSPVDDVTEIAGVAVLPAYRRRGLAAALTHVLARDALANGVTTVFCSAQSADVARVYESIGFRRVATACIAEVPDSP